MKKKINYKDLVLLTYTPRLDVNLKEYEEWLVKVDNPFFNSIKEVAHYSNWKVVSKSIKEKFNYFDFLCFETLSDFNKAWNSKELNTFTREWRRLWGQAPDSNKLHLNAKVYLLKKLDIEFLELENFVEVKFLKKKNTVLNVKGTWQLVESLRDESNFNLVETNFIKTLSETPDEITGKIIAG